ncbi:putative pleiotropic drug resistance protein 3-like [Cocos nucifera]|uniref:Putative pleiotropic drug resistance protein 3-like n=1 Tax=Cocos nucifera TaxID=13894 RepID=A0A8K0IAM8_COCNU|nr:putative pleiotropic drug resistance protein 3-like [Cocos nucifera]
MARVAGRSEAESLGGEIEETGRSTRSSFQLNRSSSQRISSIHSAWDIDKDMHRPEWAAIERLPTCERVRTSLFDRHYCNNDGEGPWKEREMIDVTKLGALERRLFIDHLIKNIEKDNLRLLQRQRERIDRVNVELPTMVVRYKNLRVEAKCQVVQGSPCPPYGMSPRARFRGLVSHAATLEVIVMTNQSKLSSNKQSKFFPQATGEVPYNGFKLEEFVPDETSAYISQYDLHMPEMTIMGLDICADMIVGDAMRRGISGGQKKRLTTAPETYDLFDDIILMAEGKIVYHGPRSHVLSFFEDCGFRCPERKGAAESLQEVLSRKDQEKYWFNPRGLYAYVSADQFSEKFKAHHIGQNLERELEKISDGSQWRKNALSFDTYSLSKWELFKACMARELLLMKRNSFVYLFNTTKLAIVAIIVMTVFLRTRMGVDIIHANYYLGSLYSAMILLMINGLPELAMTASRLPVFYRQRDSNFYPAWAYAIPASILKIPISLIESFIWTSLTYYVIGYSPEVARFFRHFLLLFLVHQVSLSLFRFLASFFQTLVISSVSGTVSLLLMLLFGGFILPQPSMPGWLKWGFWISPMTYLVVNEFLAPRWQKAWNSYSTDGGQWSRENHSSRCVLAGRKTTGHFEGDIRIGGFPKVQETFTRILGYCEQIDIHSPQMTVEESVVYSAWLRLPSQIDPDKTRTFVDEVLETIELDQIKDALVGMPGFNGLSTEQRKRLTIAVELVSNPSVIFMDEPTTGLDARAAAIVMRAVKNVAETGRTVVCTIHQPSVEIFETFDEGISGVPRIKENYNPATWMLEVTSTSMEMQLGIDFAQIYRESSLFKDNKELAKQLSTPLPHSKDLNFPTRFPQKGWEQFKACLWKQYLSYWRSPSYNLVRVIVMLISSMALAALFWKHGKTITDGGQWSRENHSSRCVLAGRKTTGHFEGDIRIGGFPKVQETFTRILGYCEQIDIHSPQMTVEESVVYSAWLRLPSQIDPDKTRTFVDEVLETIELDQIKDALVGMPGFNGLSTEQRKRLTIAVELVSNPSVIFMDEPTTGLDARAAAIVMRAVKNVAETGRTVVCTIHQPSVEIFETFDEGISGVPRIKENYNPATWMLEVTSTSMEMQLGIDFAQIYRESSLFKDNKELAKQLSTPLPHSKDLNFPTRFPQKVLSFVATERTILYQETSAGIYPPWAYSIAQVVIEIPYVLLQVVLFMIVAYPAIGYYCTAYKFFWFAYTMFCTLLYYTYLGMLLVSLTPNVQVATVLSSFCYTLLNLFSGFIAPGPEN